MANLDSALSAIFLNGYLILFDIHYLTNNINYRFVKSLREEAI
ncbi:hypothetical protein ACFRAE_08715 [Sphingobacterium sp. HJSM2_6]